MGNTSEFLVDYRSSEYLSYGGPTSTWEAKSSYNYSFPAPEIIKHTTERFLYFPLLTRAQFYGSKSGFPDLLYFLYRRTFLLLVGGLTEIIGRKFQIGLNSQDML